MIGRVLLAALLAGIAAGLLMGMIQHLRITPLILEAEKYEHAPAHQHGAQTGMDDTGMAQMGPAAAAENEWKPENRLERTLFTILASLVAGAGFAALLAGISVLCGMRITPRNGVLWGLAGFMAVHLAPAAGLAPELPGIPAADLVTRQIWWVGTIVATAVGIGLLALRRDLWSHVLGVVIMLLPHLIGAPAPPTHESAVPAGLAAEFAATTLAAAAVFWCCIGTFLGFAMERLAPEAPT